MISQSLDTTSIVVNDNNKNGDLLLAKGEAALS